VQCLYTFVRELAQIKEPVHLLICIARQEQLRHKIMALKLAPHITMTIIGFTDRISDLMAIADILITKSGSVSVNEALYMNLPMILDATSHLLSWEKYNHTFIEQHQLGISL